MRILIVDDDIVSSNFLLKILSEFSVCDIAVNGIEAVDAFLLAHEEGNPYDLICLDLMLPLFDGADALSTIRKIEDNKKIEHSKKVKVIITSALNDKELITRLSKSGFDEYFIKPIDLDKLLRYIKRIKI
jgi:two-component system chemotaxis response regulator CheY